jgi:hypothetical protein
MNRIESVRASPDMRNGGGRAMKRNEDNHERKRKEEERICACHKETRHTAHDILCMLHCAGS